MKFSVMENMITLEVDGNIYNEDVLHKCLYWYTGKFTITVETKTGGTFIIKISGESITPDLPDQIRRDLIDFKLRDIVTKETKTIRDLIVAKAFAYYDQENNPLTAISDPVGFNPETI